MAQLRLMFRSLLIERFKIEAKTSVAELPIYTLDVVKNEPKLKPDSPATDVSSPQKPGWSISESNGTVQVTAVNAALKDLVEILTANQA